LLPAVIKGFIYIAMLTFCLVLGAPPLLRATCPPNNQPVFTSPETLASDYQPPAPDVNPLRRIRFVSPGGALQRPTVLMLPPDVFNVDFGEHGVSSERGATYDLVQAGFLVFQVNHRIAPPDKVEGQYTEGHAPDQTDDLKRHILAALADPRCNGSIYLIGGSAGGTLALWCALDPAPTVDGWDENARAHIKAMVSLSGPADFCDYRNLGGIPDEAMEKFQDALDNYVDLDLGTDCEDDPDQKLSGASPVWLVTHGATSNPPPIRLYATDGDSVPYVQEDDMFTALKNQFGQLFDVKKYRMNFQYGTPHFHA
jgi:pimeloyl-ACP methyl ester carboxylesterase